MKKIKSLAVLASVVGVIGVGGFAYAATPADIASELTGKSVELLQQARQEGKTYGQIAREDGKSEEFKAQMLEKRIAVINERVSEGKITQEQADQIINSIKEKQANCDGEGVKELGKKHGLRFGKGDCEGKGMAKGERKGNGRGNAEQTRSGNGMKLGNKVAK